MKPFRAQYLPTNTSNEDSNKELRAQKKHGDEEGQKWTSKYLFRLPLKMGVRRKKKKININDINGVEEDGEGVDDIMVDQISVEEAGSASMLIDSQSNS